MDKISINFDLTIIHHVSVFLSSYFSTHPLEKPAYQVAAATAIACESVQLPTIGRSQTTGSGLTIESVMRHIQNLSR